MTTETIQISTFIPAEPMAVYSAWLSSEEHSKFSGSKAEIDARVGGRFTAGDGYISGTNRALLEGRRIVQSWRTTEFPPDSPDSLLEIFFDPEESGTHVTLVHRELPRGQGLMYEKGWREYYLEPLVKYFGGAKKPSAAKAPAKKAAAKKPAGKARAKR